MINSPTDVCLGAPRRTLWNEQLTSFHNIHDNKSCMIFRQILGIYIYQSHNKTELNLSKRSPINSAATQSISHLYSSDWQIWHRKQCLQEDHLRLLIRWCHPRWESACITLFYYFKLITKIPMVTYRGKRSTLGNWDTIGHCD